MRSFIVAAGLLTLIASGCQARNTNEEAPKSTPTTSHSMQKRF